MLDELLCRQSKQMCCTTKHCTSYYWHSKWMETQNGAINPFSLISSSTRAYKILYSMTTSLLDNYKLKVAAFLVCAGLLELKAR